MREISLYAPKLSPRSVFCKGEHTSKYNHPVDKHPSTRFLAASSRFFGPPAGDTRGQTVFLQSGSQAGRRSGDLRPAVGYSPWLDADHQPLVDTRHGRMPTISRWWPAGGCSPWLDTDHQPLVTRWWVLTMVGCHPSGACVPQVDYTLQQHQIINKNIRIRWKSDFYRKPWKGN